VDVTGLQERAARSTRPSAVTIGVFDGVHRGHQAVLRRTVALARAEGLDAVAVTFDRPWNEPPHITTQERKAGLIRALGLDALVVLRFDEHLSRLPPEAFVRDVLVEALHARHVIVGENFHFGHGGAGTVRTLVALGADQGFAAEGVPLLTLDGRTVSSSSIRAAVAEGDLAWPALALGRRFSVDGRVVRGAGRGAGLGFPTANLAVSPKALLPARGIYAGRALWGDRSNAAAIDVGTNPTFGWEILHVEAFLLDFGGDLAGEDMTVEFWQRLRDEVRFDATDDLIRQMAMDVAATRRVVDAPQGESAP
jgi:riboflavin kinase/FMN adenylyltransferase